MKAILLVRVSTDRQTLDEQSLNLQNYALKDGFSNNDIIIIEDKESGIKLSEEERNGLNELKKYINDGIVNTVYVWELSRLARTPEVLYSIRKILIDNKIQLKVYKPEFQLLDNNTRQLDNNGSMLFALYTSLAEAEIQNKKDRFKRSKQKNARTGKYSGGYVKLGYKLDDNGYYIIDEEKAAFVRLVFELYVSGLSQPALAKELKQRGYPIRNSNQVRNILISEEYTGFTDKWGFDRTYPQIISKELFEKCKEKAATNYIYAEKAKYTYYCSKLITCKCGGHYMAMRTGLLYFCKNKKYNPTNDLFNEKKHNNHGGNININLLDSIIWEYAKRCETDLKLENIQENKQIYSQKIDVLREKMSKTDIFFHDLDKKRERNNDMYFAGAIDKAKFQENNTSIDNEIKQLKDDIINMNSEIQLYNKMLLEVDTKSKIMESVNNYADTIEAIIDDNLRVDLIRKNIKSIEITDILNEKNNFYKDISITQYNDEIAHIIVNTRTKKAKMVIHDNTAIDFEYKFLNRFPFQKRDKK